MNLGAEFYARDYGAKVDKTNEWSSAALSLQRPISQETLFIAAMTRAYCLLLRHYSLHLTLAGHGGASSLENRIPADDK